jgi:hypothetical protein
MALEGISHDITPDRHIVTLYTNPARIYTYFILDTDELDDDTKGLA